MRLLTVLLCLVVLSACPASDEDTADPVVLIDPPPEGQGYQLRMETVAPPNSEIWMCQVGELPTDTITYVNSVEYQQTPGLHHMTLSTPGLLVDSALPPGMYDCEEVYTGDFMSSQVMFFGSQGTDHETMYLPEGVVADMPRSLDVVHEVHFVNTTSEPVDVYSVVNAYTIPESQRVEGIWGGSVRDEHINMPADADEYTEWSRCVFNEDVEVLFLASHTHAMGTNFTIREFDGTESGPIFYENDDWHDPKITQFVDPIIRPAGSGFEWACTWRNRTDHLVEYGLTADDEMCNMAVVHTPFSTTAKCEVVETSDGVIWEQ